MVGALDTQAVLDTVPLLLLEEESADFEKDRVSKLNQLKERQNRELDAFDEECIRIGFTRLAITSSPIYPAPDLNSPDSASLTPAVSVQSLKSSGANGTS